MIEILNPLLPNAKELRALRLFVSTDETRANLAQLWAYASDGGASYVATDGHTEIVRRSGTHRIMALHEIAKLEPFAVDATGTAAAAPNLTPPRWDIVLKVGAPAGAPGKLAAAYGINPDYVARIGDVERAAGGRNADDFKPSPGMSIKDQKKHRNDAKLVFAVWTLPSDPLDVWFWRLSTSAALWEGVIMPRRV